MQGRILSFSVQTNTGVISADDGNRYSFGGDEWRISDPPSPGMRVDFDTNGEAATGIYEPPGTAEVRVAAGASEAIPSGPVTPIPILGVIGMACGILALVFIQKDLFGFLFVLAGLGLSIGGLMQAQALGQYARFAQAGIVLSAGSLVFDIFIAIIVWAILRNEVSQPNGFFEAIGKQILPFY